MKFFLPIFIFLSSAIFSIQETFAQTPPNFDLIKLDHSSDYKAAAPFALQTANYLLLTPYRKDNPDRTKSLQFISKWMSGTPDYSFTFGDEATKLLKGNYELLGLYMAGMAKYALENKDSARNTKLVKMNALLLLVDYCEKKENNMPINRQLKKISEAKAKGELEQLVQSL